MNITDLPIMRRYIRMCGDGWLQGWHERNGGNLTYRLTAEEAAQMKPFFDAQPRPWVAMGVTGKNLAGEYFISTGSGKYFRNVALDPADSLCVVEINEAGDSYRIVWGLSDGTAPTSELPSHILIHAVRAEATDYHSRILYHAHPSNVVALTMVLPGCARTITRALWGAMTECIMLVPQGLGFVEWKMPGSADIAQATAECMREYPAVVWAHHGLFTSGSSFQDVFGMAHTIDKAAGIYLSARAANGGSDEFASTISNENLLQICDELSLDCKREWLE